MALSPARRRRRAESAPQQMQWAPRWDDPLKPMILPRTDAKYPDELLVSYEILDTVGDGGFAKVKLARHRMTGIQVAIKMISKTILARKNELYRAANEIAALQLLKHRNIISLYQVLESKTRVFLVLEYGKGGELFDYICAQGKIKDENKARDIFRDILGGLAYMHDEGFHHRDLKPENMLFNEHRVLKLIDLGLVSMPGEDHTRTSCGSANYAAPEVIQGDLYHAAKGDCWSLGVVLYAMLCGFLPFDDSDLKRLGAKIRRGTFSEPPWLSEQALDLIRSLIVVNPEERLNLDGVLSHPWVLEGLPAETTAFDFRAGIISQKIDMQVISNLARHYGKSESAVLEQVRRDVYDHITADYQLMCIAKERLQPVFLYSGKGHWKPRKLQGEPEEQAKQPELTRGRSETEQLGGVPLPTIDVESDEEDDNASSLSSATGSAVVSPLGSPKTGRRRGFTATSPQQPKKLTNLFRRLTLTNRSVRDMPTVGHSHLLVNYRTTTSYDEVRSMFMTYLQAFDALVRIKEKQFAMTVTLSGRMTSFQEIRVIVEFLRIGVTDQIGMRFKRVKGDTAAIQRFVTIVKREFSQLDPGCVRLQEDIV